MSKTITLSDEVFEQINRLAEQSHQSFESALVERLKEADNKLREIIGDLPDGVVLQLADMQMTYDESQELSDLLYDNQTGALDESRRNRLGDLMEKVGRANLIKATALVEAVERGLRARGPYGNSSA